MATQGMDGDPYWSNPTKMTLDVGKPSDPEGLTIEAWAQGYMVGSLIIMTCVAVANMRRHVLLHKLIVIEVRSKDLCRDPC